MDPARLVKVARRASRLTQAQLAALAGTSQATLSAYERGLKAPSLGTASRIIEATDHELTLQARIDWREHHPQGIVAFWVPQMLWAVPPPACFVTLWFPDLIDPGTRDTWDLSRRDDRRRAYTLLVRRGLPQQMIRWMDGGLLVDMWDELDLPDSVRAAWEPTIRGARVPVGKTKVDSLGFIRREDSFEAPTARIRDYEPLPKPPPPPRPKQRRTRFDPRPPEPD